MLHFVPSTASYRGHQQPAKLLEMGSVMINKLDKQTCKSEFESHWVPHSFSLVLHLSKKLGNLLHIIGHPFFHYIDSQMKWEQNLPSQLGLKNTLTAPLQRGKTPRNECPGYDTKQSDGEVLAMLELWGMRSTPLLPLLPGPLWPGVVAPDKDPIYGLNRINSDFMLKWIVWVKLNSLK